MAIKWHPIPPNAESPSGNLTVEVLWGHPEQKYIDLDVKDSPYILLSTSEIIFILLLSDSTPIFWEYLLKIILDKSSAVNSPYPGTSDWLFSSFLPTINGLFG